MKRLILAALGLAIGVMLGLMVLDRLPKPERKLPDARYSPPAISSATVDIVKSFTVLMSDESMAGIGRGTGVLIDSTTVLTVAHMLSTDHSAKSMWIYPYPGAQVVHAKVKFVNYPKDLALLTLDTPVTGHKFAKLASDMAIGEPIVVCGNIEGYMMWFVSYGILSGEHDRWVLTDAVIRGGNSGGPWVNMKGEIVALTDVGWNDRNGNAVGVSGGVPVKDLKRFMAEANKKKSDIMYVLTGE